MGKRILLLVLACIISIISINSCIYAASNDNNNLGKVEIVINGTHVGAERDPVLINGRTLVAARTILNEMGASVDWYSKIGLITVYKDDMVINLNKGDTTLIINNKPQTMDVGPITINGTVMIPITYIAQALNYNIKWDSATRTVYIDSNTSSTTNTSNSSTKENARKFVVVIDAGHGGKETGAIAYGQYEKTLNWAIAKKLEPLLEASGIKTYMTREDDTYVGLYERSGLANSVNADLLISIHNNAGSSSTTAGSMSLYCEGSNGIKGKLTAKKFASIVQNELLYDLGTKNLGVINRPHLAVLRTAKMPAVLAEIKYMTNKTELESLKTSLFQEQAAKSLRDAVVLALNSI